MATPAKCLAIGRNEHRAAKLQGFDVVNLVTPFAARLAAVTIPVKHSEPEPIPRRTPSAVSRHYTFPR